ncbi:hypothetical protein IGI04_036631 [Brassica rapa subsp. trilocularis]|uniref:Peroxin-7 n=1 Tax=Brassica rapa subsp. trilocularis TaxID=1813537 RepID=A0ABQ7LIU0_BRACM|nr:hypothetical protein IGI04_036631 [Brassica rapa subsp. trilocularis]
MPMFKAPFNGYSVKFSPFYESRLAVATAQNFGILGNGRIHVLELSPGGPGVTESIAFDTADAVYDVCWSESHDSVLIAAIGDGSVKIYDTALPPPSNPIRSFQEHAREVHSVDYNPTRRDSFLTASWDDTVKLWAMDRPASIRTFKEHAYCVYQAVWNPKHGDVFASASGDCTLRIWDVREPGSTMIIPAHDLEILSCDWNKAPLAVLNGHGYAVRKVKFSPHRRNLIASCSYDMSVCLWDYMVEDALTSHHPRTLGPTQLKRTIPPLFLLLPVKSPALEVRETGSEIYDTTRPPPPLAAAHSEERETRPGEREKEARRGERERKETRRRERKRRETAREREKESTARDSSLRGFSAGLRF